MEFKTLKNIESAFQLMKRICLFSIIVSFVICIGSVIISFGFADKQRQKVYILEEGKSLLTALSQDAELNRPAEARSHVKLFHELFFSYTPDKSAIESNLSRALTLSDDSPFSYYEEMVEDRYFTRLIAANAIQYVDIEKIEIDFDVYPYVARTYATTRVVRRNNTRMRTLVTSCSLINLRKSDDNPHGFLIKNFQIIENKDINEKTTE